MVDKIKRTLLSAVRWAGYEVVRVDPVYPAANRRLTMMRHHGIDAVLDVGANTGQYASALRQAGFQGDILSFEPLSDAFRQLEEYSRCDPKWRVYRFAVGGENTETEINI